MFKKLIPFLRKISFPVPLQMLIAALCWGFVGLQIGEVEGAKAQRIEDNRDYAQTRSMFWVYKDSTKEDYPLVLSTDYYPIGWKALQQGDSIRAQELFQGQEVVIVNDTLCPSKLVFKK